MLPGPTISVRGDTFIADFGMHTCAFRARILAVRFRPTQRKLRVLLAPSEEQRTFR